jgi:hypothetical protein
LSKIRLRVFAFSAAAALVLSGCGGETAEPETEPAADDAADEAAADDVAAETEEEVEEEPDADVEEEVEESAEEAGDMAGEGPGVVLLAEPITHSEGGLELEIDAVRIISIEELSETAGEDLSEYLDDANAVTMVGLRVTVRNTTDETVDWYPGGSGSAIVLAGQQGPPSFLGDWGETLRANAELELNPYYESRVPVDEARAAGEFIWDVGEAYSEADYETITDPELTISYSY